MKIIIKSHIVLEKNPAPVGTLWQKPQHGLGDVGGQGELLGAIWFAATVWRRSAAIRERRRGARLLMLMTGDVYQLAFVLVGY